MATTVEYDFLRDIIDHPDDDALRLIYADWLEDNGDPRGEFIRVQVELAKLDDYFDRFGVPAEYTQAERIDALRRREGELLEEYGFDWFGQFLLSAKLDEGRGPERNAWQFRTIGGVPGWFGFVRGFIGQWEGPLVAWCGERCQGYVISTGYWPCGRNCLTCEGSGFVGRHGPRLVRCTPLETVRLSDVRLLQREDGVCGLSLDGSSECPAMIRRVLDAEHAAEPVGWEANRQAAFDAASTALLAWARTETP